MTKVPRQFLPAGLMVVLAYAFFAGLWILLSDRVMGVLVTDPATLVRASMLKGWFFVAVTSLLLYVLVSRLVGRLDAAHQRELEHERAQKLPPPMLVAIADASGDAIVAKDTEGRFLLCNNAACRIVGKQVGEVIGKDDYDLFPSHQAEALRATGRRIVASGRTETNLEELQTVDGPRIFHSTQGPLRDQRGKIFGTYGISRDITERTRADVALHQLADDMKATLQAIPDLMFEVDDQGHYLKVKASNEALLAAPPEQLLGRSVGDILPREAADTVMSALSSAGRHGSDFGRTIMLPIASVPHYFELSVARKPVAEGQADRFIVLSRDITTRMSAETELRRRNVELERFNRAATERELRMLALKREVNELARATGRPEPYDTSFADTDGTGGPA